MRSTVNTCGAAKETERFGAGRVVGMHMVCGLWCDGCGGVGRNRNCETERDS